MPVGRTFGVGELRDSSLMVSVFSEKWEASHLLSLGMGEMA